MIELAVSFSFCASALVIKSELCVLPFCKYRCLHYILENAGMLLRNLSNSIVVVSVFLFATLAVYGQSLETFRPLSPKIQPFSPAIVNNLASQAGAPAKPSSGNSGQSGARKTAKEPKKEPKPIDKTAESNTTPAISLKEKEQLLQETLADVSYTAFMIEPVEYSIIVQVEVASLLWEKERERASEMLTNARTRLRELLTEKKRISSSELDVRESELEIARLRQAILRRIAKLSPDLIKDLITEVNTSNDIGAAIVANAVEEIKRDPKLAMQLAVQGLSYGAIYPASTFLIQLWFEDKQLAEMVALVYLDKLPVESTSSLWLVTQIYSYLSPPMKERYFKSLATRLRLCLRPDLSIGEYRELSSAASKGVMQAVPYPAWNQEFARLAKEVETLMTSRFIATPVSPAAKAVSMSGMLPASSGDTAEIETSAQKLEALKNRKIKDSEYKKLAIEAAEKWDVTLAERLLSKISDEDVRRQASPHVYGPLVRKSLGENDWPQARSYALRVTDPLGLSLIVDSVAKAMLNTKQDKQVVNTFYDEAFSNLDREIPSLYVAKGVIALARSRFSVEPEGGFTTTNLAVSVLNGSDTSDFYSSKSRVTKGLDPWVNQTNLILRVDDYFDLTETIGPIFKDLSRHNFAHARELSLSLSHLGLRSLAQLGIAKGIQDELKGAGRVGKSNNQASPEK